MLLYTLFPKTTGKKGENYIIITKDDDSYAVEDYKARIYAENPYLDMYMEEILELLYMRRDAIDIVTERVEFIDERYAALELYSTYTRDQLLLGLGYMNPSSMREGVKWLEHIQTDCLLVTFNKSDNEYSPSTMYEDYAIDHNFMHCQSQNNTSETSKVGHRYINHEKMNTEVIMFVRESRNDEYGSALYTFLGRVKYVSHTGSKPMSIVWKMERPIPSKILVKSNQMII